MKKITFFIIIIFLQLSTYAQSIQGSVDVQNETDCGIAWDVVAICPGPPQCQEYSTLTMNLLPAGTSTGNMSFFTYPWFTPPGAPTCTNWSWSYAHVSLFGNGNCEAGSETLKVGIQDCSGSALNKKETFECICNGQTVYVDFIVYSSGGSTNNVIVKIHY